MRGVISDYGGEILKKSPNKGCVELRHALRQYLAKNRGKLENKVYAVPVEIDREVAEIKLRSNGIKIDYLSDEQKAYLAAAE